MKKIILGLAIASTASFASAEGFDLGINYVQYDQDILSTASIDPTGFEVVAGYTFASESAYTNSIQLSYGQGSDSGVDLTSLIAAYRGTYNFNDNFYAGFTVGYGDYELEFQNIKGSDNELTPGIFAGVGFGQGTSIELSYRNASGDVDTSAVAFGIRHSF